MLKRNCVPLTLLIVFLGMASGLAQTRLLEFSPGARSISLGRTGVVDIYDPSALYWNPAALGVLRTSRGMVAIHNPFLINFAGFSQYFPLVGSMAINFGRTGPEPEAIEMASFGMGFRLSPHFFIGASLSGLQREKEGWTAGGIGFLFKPSHTLSGTGGGGFLASPWVADRLAVGVCVQNIPLIISDYDHQTRLGISYALSDFGPRLVYAYHFQRGDDSNHLGASFDASENVSFFAGVRNFDAKLWAFGAEFRTESMHMNLVYDPELKRIVFSASVRLSPDPRKLAEREFKRARESLQAGDKRNALHFGELALAHDPDYSQAADIVSILHPIVKKEDAKIDSLFRLAQRYEQKKWYISAAANYLRILKLNPNDERTRNALAMIRPRVNIYTERWYQAAVRYFESGELARAKDIFESIVLVRPEHKESKKYLAKIQEIFNKKAEEHYFTGLGYYSQRKLGQAEKEFQAALEIDPNHADARAYLERIAKERQNLRQRIENLMAEARNLERNGSLRTAQRRYQQILDLDPDNQLARRNLTAVTNRLNAYVQNQYRRGERAYRNKSFASAEKYFRSVLAVNPNHPGARRYLRLISSANDKSNPYIERARKYMAAQEWQKAIAVLDSALAENPNLQEASRLRAQTMNKLDLNQVLENAKSEYLSGRYLEAMESFNQVLEKDPNNTEAQELRELCQSKLNEQVDEFFNRGLRFYTEEKYRSAIAEWEKALKINPYHQGSLEYKKRAEERLEALKRMP